MSLALAANVADIAGQGPASVLFGVCDIISNSANAVRFNKEAATALATRIRDIVSALTEEHTVEDFKPSPEWTAGINNFKCALDTITQDLQGISKQTFLAQALHRERDAEAIRAMGQRVRDVTALFMTKARMEILDHVQVLNTALESATNAVTAPSVPAQRLEPPPAYYFGRGAETESAVTMLDSDLPAYLAILGGPGMGKTSLARAILHHPALTTRFGLNRYFVACDAADARMTLLSLLSSAFGIATSSGSAAKRALKSVLHGPSLLVLDNFESAWESQEQRRETEDLLEFLAGINGLSVMITLRGSERPHGVAWTIPHLPPLATLGSSFATQLFVTISDIDEAAPDFLKLLACTDNIPLAIVLLANLAQYERSHTLLARWEEQKTAMLQRNDGSDHLTSMDVSLSLSITSPRVTACPPAVQLLGLLSMLPQGACRSDVEAWFPTAEVSRSISVLLQTALAVWNNRDQLYVLAPIREFMLSKHHPQPTGLAALFGHYWALAHLINPEGQESSSPAAVACVLPQLENIYSVTFHGLEDSTYQKSAAAAAVNLAYLLVDTGFGSFDILNKALLVSRTCNLANITASLLLQWGILARQSAVPGDSKILLKEAQSLYHSTGNLGGIIDTTLRLSSSEPPEQAIKVSEAMYRLAKEAILEDEAATDLLAAIMPPLLHSGLNGLLADAFLTSADIALRQNNTQLAHHRVRSAMRYLEEVDTVKLHERAATMLEKCTAAPTV
ncbi:hypothetical protein EXIGLDRAFT_766347 [Exidia glandulosa HHB12029]|uniref:Novel STAND NTPase 1 domain-containing protein n=1 Tax=Exidia glandulosa HHB12029 TaxID=1314781 RepID=A0A165JU40_EXIGL|nr:hypothetical protein EXIGLDRAFT_766347 [Exidia glandulosa HHB12029]